MKSLGIWASIMKKYYITGTRRGLGKALSDAYHTVDTLEECDVFY